MKTRELIEFIEVSLEHDKLSDDEVWFPRRIRDEILIRLEKLEPKKIKDFHHCPNCGYGLPAKGITNDYCDCCFEWDFCPYCGQALDWSRKNDRT